MTSAVGDTHPARLMSTALPGPLALVGSGEYLAQMADIESGLLAGRPPRYVQLATAAVPDGPAVVERWHNLGIATGRAPWRTANSGPRE